MASVSALRKTTKVSGTASSAQRGVVDRHRLDRVARSRTTAARAAPGLPARGRGDGAVVLALPLALRVQRDLSVCACCSILAAACRTESGQVLPSPMPLRM